MYADGVGGIIYGVPSVGGVDGRATVALGLYRSSFCMFQGLDFSCLIYMLVYAATTIPQAGSAVTAIRR
jgi:hypothetical protein